MQVCIEKIMIEYLLSQFKNKQKGLIGVFMGPLLLFLRFMSSDHLVYLEFF